MKIKLLFLALFCMASALHAQESNVCEQLRGLLPENPPSNVVLYQPQRYWTEEELLAMPKPERQRILVEETIRWIKTLEKSDMLPPSQLKPADAKNLSEKQLEALAKELKKDLYDLTINYICKAASCFAGIKFNHETQRTGLPMDMRYPNAKTVKNSTWFILLKDLPVQPEDLYDDNKVNIRGTRYIQKYLIDIIKTKK